MKTLFSSVISLAFLFSIGCGQSGTSTGAGSSGSGGGSESGLTGTVSVPRSTTTSVSLSLKSADNASSDSSSDSSVSVSKSSDSSEDSSVVSTAKAEEEPRIIVSKATVNDSNVSGPVELWTIDGSKLLDTCEAKQGVFYYCGFDCAKLDSSKQILVKVFIGDDVITSVVDATNCSNGSTVAASESNSQTSVVTQLTYQAGDSSATPDNVTSTFKAALADGTLKPKQVYQTQNGVFGIGAPVSVDSSQGAATAVGECIKNAMAALPMKPADIKKALEGGGVLSQCTSSVNLSTAVGVLGKLPDATKNFFKDSATAGKWTDASALQALAKNWGAYDSAEFQSVIDNPANARGLFNKYADDFAAGVSNAFAKMEQGGKSFGNYLEKFGTTAMGSAQFLAAKDLFDNCSFGGGVDQSKLGEALYSQVFSADTQAEIDKLRAQKGSIGSLLVGNPDAYIGAAGLTAAQGFINFLGTGGSLTGATPCATDVDCSGGKICGASHLCSTSSAGLGDGSGVLGAKCSVNGDCATNVCTGGFCDIGSGVSFATLGTQKYFGDACTTTAECSGGLTCNTTCGGAAPPSSGPNLCKAWTRGSSTSACFGAGTGTGTATSGTCGGATAVIRVPYLITALGTTRNVDITIAGGVCSAATRQYNSGGSTENQTAITTCTANQITMTFPGTLANTQPCTLDLLPQ